MKDNCSLSYIQFNQHSLFQFSKRFKYHNFNTKGGPFENWKGKCWLNCTKLREQLSLSKRCPQPKNQPSVTTNGQTIHMARSSLFLIRSFLNCRHPNIWDYSHHAHLGLNDAILRLIWCVKALNPIGKQDKCLSFLSFLLFQLLSRNTWKECVPTAYLFN